MSTTTSKGINADKGRETQGPISIVRQNLLSRPGYTPYCGNEKCYAGMPRTTFNGSQFQCKCGWRSQFEAEFIEKYKAFRADSVALSKSGAK